MTGEPIDAARALAARPGAPCRDRAPSCRPRPAWLRSSWPRCRRRRWSLAREALRSAARPAARRRDWRMRGCVSRRAARSAGAAARGRWPAGRYEPARRCPPASGDRARGARWSLASAPPALMGRAGAGNAGAGIHGLLLLLARRIAPPTPAPVARLRSDGVTYVANGRSTWCCSRTAASSRSTRRTAVHANFLNGCVIRWDARPGRAADAGTFQEDAALRRRTFNRDGLAARRACRCCVTRSGLQVRVWSWIFGSAYHRRTGHRRRRGRAPTSAGSSAIAAHGGVGRAVRIQVRV